jgi:hypothetical protein
MHSAIAKSSDVDAVSAHVSKELTSNSDARETLTYSTTGDSSERNVRSSK